jgi:hypothetical protein
MKTCFKVLFYQMIMILFLFAKPSLCWAESGSAYHYLIEGTYGQSYHHHKSIPSYGLDLEVIFPDDHWGFSIFCDYEKEPEATLHQEEDRVLTGVSLSYLFGHHIKAIFGIGNSFPQGGSSQYSTEPFVRTGLGYEWHPHKNHNIVIIPTYFIDHTRHHHDQSIVLGMGYKI